MSKARRFPRRRSSLLRQRLLDGDPARTGFMFHLARSADLVHVQGRTVSLQRERVRLWLKKPRTEQLAGAAESVARGRELERPVSRARSAL